VKRMPRMCSVIRKGQKSGLACLRNDGTRTPVASSLD
jgi:hypothetical protein